jgi:type II secretory pathway pseudopilin PulG
MKRHHGLAFTLIELLTVIAITAVLLTIIVVPVIQSFNLTRQAQAYAEAQNQARVLSERIAREIGNSVGLRDLSTFVNWTDHNGVARKSPASSLAIILPMVANDGSRLATATPTEVILPYSKLDIIQPAKGQPDSTLGPGVFRDPGTGYIDPTLHAPKGQALLPIAPGMTIVRYWIGLRQPVSEDGQHSQRYNDPYTGFLLAANASRDNLYVLYRAEVQPYVFRAPANGASGSPAYRPNLNYFKADPTDSFILDEDDPLFFSLQPTVDVSSEATGALTTVGQAKALRMIAWQKAATVQTEVSRYDMIFPIYDKSTRKIHNSNGVPQILSLAQFRPERISAETVAGQTATQLGLESASGAAVAPDAFLTQYGLWSNPIVRTLPVGWIPGSTSGVGAAYEVGRRDPNVGLMIFAYEPGVTTGDDITGGTPIFDVDAYQTAVSTGTAYPFTLAVNSAAAKAGTAPFADAVSRQIFTPYSINTQTGKIISSFNIAEVGVGAPLNPKATSNIPWVQTCPGANFTPDPNQVYTPIVSGNPATPNDPILSNGGTFSDAVYSSINEKFNKIWTDYPSLRPNIHRFIDLRTTLQGDGTPSPLYPDPVSSQATGFGATFDASGHNRYSKVSIVPGTDEVIGPDQLAGPNYGQPVRYTRVTQNPGPNQYCLNYTDLAEPTDANGNLDYPSVYGAVGNPQTTYSATDFATAVLQPRYKVGYLQLCSDPTIPLPAGFIEVSYRFQISGRRTGSVSFLSTATGSNSDTFSVDYDSRQLINVLLTVRNYPQSNTPNPQSVTLKSTATVRNYLR